MTTEENKARRKVEVKLCPSCGSDLAVIDLIEHTTPEGVNLGGTYIKCKSGCSVKQIIHAFPRKPRKQLLSDSMFLDVIDYARTQEKKITMADKEREVSIKMSRRRLSL